MFHADFAFWLAPPTKLDYNSMAEFQRSKEAGDVEDMDIEPSTCTTKTNTDFEFSSPDLTAPVQRIPPPEAFTSHPPSNPDFSQQLTQQGARKRVRGGEECEGGRERVIEKRVCEEGMSWWTCLMLGMDQENTKAQVVRRFHSVENK